MTPARCPSCDAALPAGAQWCTLCFADLRPPAPEPVAEPVVEAVAEPVAEPAQTEPALVSAGAPGLPIPQQAGAQQPAPEQPVAEQRPGRHALRPEELPVMTGADAVVGRPGWPCQACGAAVPLELTECVKCGSGFMAMAKSTVGLKLPVVGEVTEMSTGGRFALMATGAVVVAALFLLVLVLLAAIF